MFVCMFIQKSKTQYIHIFANSLNLIHIFTESDSINYVVLGGREN